MTQRPEYRLREAPRFSTQIPAEAPALLHLLPEDFDLQVDRRRFLQAGAVGLGGLLAACGDEEPIGPGDPDFDLLTFCSEEVGAHQGIANFAVSPDGRFVASGGTGRGDNHFKLWEVATGRLVTSLTYRGAGFNIPVAFSPTGAFVATRLPGRVVLVAVPDGTLIAEWENGLEDWTGPFALAVSSDAQWLAYDNLGQALVVNTADGSEVVVIDTPTGGTQSLALSPDGTVLAVAGYSNSPGAPVVHLYSLPDGQLLGTLTDADHEHHPLRRVTFSSDGATLVSSSESHAITLWDVATRSILRRIEGPGGNLPGFRTHGIDRADRIYAISVEGLEIYSLDGNRLGGIEGLPDSRLVVVEPSPDGTQLVYGSGSSIRLYDVATGRFRNCFFDQEATARGGTLTYYSVVDGSGREIWYTLPCGDGIPEGATCTCNCVPGSAPTSGGGSGCSINFVCTCIPVVYGG